MDSLLKKIVWPILLVPAVYLACVWSRLPEQVAVHFNLHGEVDRYGNKKELLVATLILTVLSFAVYLLLTNIHRIDPKKYAVENKTRLQRMGFAVGVFMAAVTCMIIYSSTRGNLKFNPRLILAAVGLLFAVMGNYMHNIKPNYFAGYRLPWTLENEDNWKKTHLLAGKIWFSGGLLIAVACLLIPSAEISMVVFLVLMIIMTIIPAVYSYRLFKQQKNQVTNK